MSDAMLTEERERYFNSAWRSQYGTCDICKRARDDDGGRMRVVRERSSRVWRCFSCRSTVKAAL